jgi:hypothetical protein
MASPQLVTTALSEDDVEKLFSGAPQFFDRAEGHGTWAPHPSVAFPFDEELHIRDLTDHAQIEDPAWGCVTAWPHITRGGCEQYASDGSLLPPAPAVEPPRRPHFYPRCREKPSMLSAQGLEKGSAGFQAALEAGVADVLQEEQWGFEYMGSRATSIVEARQRIMAGGPDGLRRPSEALVLDLLIQCSMRYRAGRPATATRASIADELHAALFANLMHPPSRVLDHRDPRGLPSQVRHLLRILAMANVWIDFSQVAWRIRLGQILWGGGDADLGRGPGPATTPLGAAGSRGPKNDLGRRDERVEERYWLLLQILLGCEMLIRLDAITEGDELGVESINAAEVRRFETTATESVKWTLVLARCWLDNVEVVRGEPTPPSSAGLSPVLAPTADGEEEMVASAEKTSATATTATSGGGWLSALAETVKLGAASMMADHASIVASSSSSLPAPHSPAPSHLPVYKIQGLHSLRQVNGLAHFARKLRWPGADAFAARVLGIRHAATDDIATAMSARTSYFGPADIKLAQAKSSSSLATTPTPASASSAGPPTRLSRQADTVLEPSGWVSRSYLSGLVMPGESLGHLLMASLVESDADALDALGSVANLCGGFSYAGKSFWSTTCVVGRVLAAGKGATECMGWVSSDVAPDRFGDGWVDVDVDSPDGTFTRLDKRARIWDKVRVERESHIFGTTRPKSVLATDFVVPCDDSYAVPPPDVAIELDSLQLVEKAGSEVVAATPTPGTTASTARTAASIRSCSAVVAFSVQVGDGDVTEHRFGLKRDVHFVTAHPCVTSPRVRLVRSSPSSPTIRQVDVTGSLAGSTKTTCLSGHPLHRSYSYHVMHLSELLARYQTSSLQDLFTPSGSPKSGGGISPATPHRVLVIDCITGFSRQPRSPSSPLSSSSRRNSERSDDGAGPAGLASPSSPVLRRGGYFAHNWPKLGGGGGDGGDGISPDDADHDQAHGGVHAPPCAARAQGAQDKMHLESRRRQFGSDMEVLVRALCADKGWNAVVSRRRRGCLACAIREAGALDWSVIIRVD